MYFVLISTFLFSILDTISKQTTSPVILTVQNPCAPRPSAFHKRFHRWVSLFLNLIKCVIFSHAEVLMRLMWHSYQEIIFISEENSTFLIQKAFLYFCHLPREGQEEFWGLFIMFKTHIQGTSCFGSLLLTWTWQRETALK